jgi:hypothetical protein
VKCLVHPAAAPLLPRPAPTQPRPPSSAAALTLLINCRRYVGGLITGKRSGLGVQARARARACCPCAARRAASPVGGIARLLSLSAAVRPPHPLALCFVRRSGWTKRATSASGSRTTCPASVARPAARPPAPHPAARRCSSSARRYFPDVMSPRRVDPRHSQPAPPPLQHIVYCIILYFFPPPRAQESKLTRTGASTLGASSAGCARATDATGTRQGWSTRGSGWPTSATATPSNAPTPRSRLVRCSASFWFVPPTAAPPVAPTLPTPNPPPHRRLPCRPSYRPARRRPTPTRGAAQVEFVGDELVSRRLSVRGAAWLDDVKKVAEPDGAPRPSTPSPRAPGRAPPGAVTCSRLFARSR